MPTNSIRKPIVIEDDEACQRFRDALEEFEAQPPKTRIESKTSSLERGIELLRKRYPSESSETRIETKTSSFERGKELLRKRYPSESSENE